MSQFLGIKRPSVQVSLAILCLLSTACLAGTNDSSQRQPQSGVLLAGDEISVDNQALEALSSHTSDRDLSLDAESVGAASAGRDANLTGTTVTGSVSVGRDLVGFQCKGSGRFLVGRDATFQDCRDINSVSAGRNLNLTNGTVQNDATVGRNLTLRNATVHGNVTVGGEAILDNSKIDGTLSIASPYVTLNGSTVGSIKILQPSYSSVSNINTSTIVSNGGGSVIGNGVVVSRGNSVAVSGGSMISGRNGQMAVSVGPSGVSTVNGYTVKGSGNQTTVMTPDGNIYVNGSKVSGSGPKTYAAYKTQNSRAPQVSGPGWLEDGGANSAAGQSAPEEAVQVVELSNQSVVNGPIIFEGTKGKVIVQPGSKLLGKVENGTVQKL